MGAKNEPRLDLDFPTKRGNDCRSKHGVLGLLGGSDVEHLDTAQFNGRFAASWEKRTRIGAHPDARRFWHLRTPQRFGQFKLVTEERGFLGNGLANLDHDPGLEPYALMPAFRVVRVILEGDPLAQQLVDGNGHVRVKRNGPGHSWRPGRVGEA